MLPALALVLAACSAGAAPSAPPSADPSTTPSEAPSESPSGSPSGETLDHPTGATDVVLRYEEGGGFMMAGFAATQIPHFTLYGDGTVIFRNPMLEGPPLEGSIFKSNPMRIAKLDEAQMQELLLYALSEGGLAGARPQYTNDMVADASTAMFTIDAGGVQKTVSVYALGLDVPGGADAPARAAFLKLAERLTDIDQGGSIPTEVYEPESYRVVLIESQGIEAPDIRAWPWPDLSVDDFAPDADPNGVQFPHRTMTAAEVAELGVDGFEGGFNGMVVRSPEGKTYTVAVRPLLPDEEA